MSNRRRDNRGYTFVEMIIVIGIMAVLAGLATVTWRSVDSANYRKSVAAFEEEVRTLRTSTMGQDKYLAMKLYKDASDGKYYVVRGVYSGNFFEDLTGFPDAAKSSYFNYEGVSNPVCIGKKGTIKYNNAEVTSAGVVIHFNKSDGSISDSTGAGTYSFYRDNGDLVMNVKIQPDSGMVTKNTDD